MSVPDHHAHIVAPYDDSVSFDELPDAPPSQAYWPSVTGWIGIVVTCFWFFIALFGSWLAPYGENDLPFPDDYSEFQPSREGALLGTDVEDRDVLSRIMYGAGRTIGIAFAATLLAYFVGVVMGIGAAVSGPQRSIWSSVGSTTRSSVCRRSCWALSSWRRWARRSRC